MELEKRGVPCGTGVCPETYLEEAFRSSKLKVKNQESKEAAGCEGIGGDVVDVYGTSDAYGREYALCGGAGEGGKQLVLSNPGCPATP